MTNTFVAPTDSDQEVHSPPYAPILVKNIVHVLKNFQGEQSIKEIFWSILSFDRVDGDVRFPIPEKCRQAFISCRLFAANNEIKILRVQCCTYVSREQIEFMCRSLDRLFIRYQLLVEICPTEAWTLVYPDKSTRQYLRLLPIPGDHYAISQTARALASLSVYSDDSERMRSWLEIAEALDTFFPGGIPRVGDLDRFIDSCRPRLIGCRTYVRDTNQFPLMTLPQEHGSDLRGDEEVPDDSGMDFHKWRLIVHNLRFGTFLALRMPDVGIDIEDLIQEANMGLLFAASKYDPSYKNRFISYAAWWINQRMWKYIYDNCNIIRWPARNAPRLLEAERTGDTYDLKMGERLVVQLDGSENAILDSRYEDGNSVERCQQDVMIAVNATLDKLTPREKKIISMRYGFIDGNEHTLEEIGRIMGLTRERVRQIEKGALKRLRHPSRSKFLKAVLWG